MAGRSEAVPVHSAAPDPGNRSDLRARFPDAFPLMLRRRDP